MHFGFMSVTVLYCILIIDMFRLFVGTLNKFYKF